MQLATLVRAFQLHAKGGGLSIDDVRKTVAALPPHADRPRMERFISLFEPIAAEWDRRLRASHCVDFEDMIVTACEHIESGRYRSPYRVVLADEFQDSSRARVRLIRALLAQAGDGAHVTAVGDDWQAINRFAGADLSAMIDFERLFEGATRLTLATTFRLPAALCAAASAFVQKNPTQIAKSVATTSDRTAPSLAAHVSHDRNASLALVEKHLIRLADEQPGANVMLLGRYRSDRPSALDNWRTATAGRLRLDVRTIHTAKGLEADYVMLLNLVAGERGFPSGIADDPLLDLVMPRSDNFPAAEERRLFYVALTRARRQVRLYAWGDMTSPFLAELEEQGSLRIRRHGDGRPARVRTSIERLPNDAVPGDSCPACGQGVLIARQGPHSVFLGCSAYPTCHAVGVMTG